MAQSSNYKQYARATRMLTEESGFAGGMLWTGNNIDETHLKAIVNCDYDETTSYLKARDPFVPKNDSPSAYDLQDLNLNLIGYRLLGVYNICAFDITDESNEELQDAGTLYVFINSTDIVINTDTTVCVYFDGEHYHNCIVDTHSDDITLRGSTLNTVLMQYENYLYGVGSNTENQDAWLQVCRVTYTADSGYCLQHRSHNNYVQPRFDDIKLLEACVSGFNAARGKDTFTYTATPTESEDELSILGVYVKDSEGNVVVSPTTGHSYKIHVPCVYDSTTADTPSYLAMFELHEGSDTTELVDSWTRKGVNTQTNGEFVFDFTFNQKKTTLGFTYYGTKDPGDSAPAYSDDAVDYLMPYQITANDKKSNLKVKHYDLTTSDGMCIWKNRMCVWSTTNSNNSLFISEVDNFFYYPVPHNVAIFDANIISCIPYKDSLLVFTATKIYRVVENNDGTFSQAVVQNDMPLSKKDAAHLTAIKNMVFFKSGNYFYMIVPKSQSLTDELSIAPIYKNIAGFLNTLDKSIQEVVQLLYPEYLITQCQPLNEGTPVSIYSEQDTVHILYDIKVVVKTATNIGTELNFKMFLNYNTNLRAWTIYFEETTNNTLEPATLTASRLMSFIRVKQNANGDKTVPPFTLVTQQATTTPEANFRLLLDTGYRTLSTSTQKRFREVQLKLYNATESITRFGTAFLVDGAWRRNYTKLQEVLLDNNTISLMPELDLNTFVTELSMPIDSTGSILKNPGSDAIELSSWTLDFSHFKREAPTTVRVPVSGKGYNPRFILMVPDAVGLTVNEINWVYRLMHGR